MAYLVWTEEEHGTGDAEIDRQHQELFLRVNNLVDACRDGRGKEEVSTIIDFLAEYVTVHFLCEERVMEERNCSACIANQLAHAQFARRFAALQEQFKREGPGAGVGSSVQHLLVEWLDSHIKKVDTILRDAA